MNDGSAAEFKAIISAVLDPLKQSCVLTAGMLDPLETAIFTVNCLHAIQVIQMYDNRSRKINLML